MQFIERIDIIGSSAMIVLSVLCVHRALVLRRREPQNIIWTYLVWFCTGLLFFTLSRSVGHLVKHMLIAADLEHVWSHLRPVSGSLNTVAFVLVGAITLFFSRVYRTYQRMLQDKAVIEKAHKEIGLLNVNLERMVEERTRDLTMSEEKYRRVFENSKDMLFICEENGEILDVNPYGVEILSFESKREVIGLNLYSDFFMGPAFESEVRVGMEERGYVKDVELRLRTRLGHELDVLFSATATQERDGEPAGFEGIVKDITARKQMEGQLLQADKLASLGQLSAGVAHEINNPLGIVLGYTRLVLKEAGLAGRPYEDLKVVEKHALNCKRIVENLLRFSRATRTTKSLANVNDLVREVTGVVENKFNLEKVQIVKNLDPDLPLTMVDGDKMSQVFMNILMNARQSIDGPGTVTVTTSWDSRLRRIWVSFEDTGCGIPPEILNKIFDPFFTTKPIGMGTGLGLAVSYGIVKDHEGEIVVDSRPGEGSVFTVDLPVKGAADENTSGG